MRKKLVLLLAALLAGTGFSAHADWRKIPAKDFSLAPPPAVGSPAYAEDFRVLKLAEAERTESDCELATIQNEPSFSLFFSAPESPLPFAQAAKARSLLIPAMQIAERVARYQKDKYRRPRPYDTEPSLRPCVKKPGGSKAYPSSHAAVATTATCILSALYPEKAAALKAYGMRLGNVRVLVGVHHPSDVSAGQLIGNEVCERLLRDQDFQAELEEILMGGSA